MNKGFWGELKKPIMVLAPMANVTDAAFRRVIAKYGKPDVMWTEFVSVEGLLSEGREKLLMDFWYTDEERPIVAQIFGAKPDQFYQIAQLCQELKFDGIDINMGCPHDGIVKSGSCAALMQNPKLAKEIIAATKRGAGKLPVSVKTRIGFNTNELETWLPNLLEAEPAAITIHARTRKEMSAVPAHWDQITRSVEIAKGSETLILGNGDVKDLKEARERVKETGADGVMLGRAIFGSPWLFSEHIPTTEEKLRVAVEHTKLFVELFADRKPFDIMKKHFKAYVSGFDGAKELRIQMMEAKTAEEIERLVSGFLQQ